MTPSRVPVATLLCLALVAPAGAGLIPGGGPAASDCYVEFDVQNVDGQSSTVTCQDGDPCDTDSACDGTCKVRLRLCMNQPSTVCSGNAPLKLKKPKLKGAKAVLAPDSVRSLTEPTCGPFANVAVKTKRGGKKPGKVTVSVTAISKNKPHRDADKLTLVCTPRVGACPPPPTSTTTSSTSTSSSTTTSTVTTTSTTLSPDVCPGLGLRILSGSTDSHAYSSALFGGQIDVAPDNFSGSLVLCAGSQGAYGVAPLSLAADAKSGIRVTMGQGFFCGAVEAFGSSGKLDCDGGTPVDVDYSIDSHGTNDNDPPKLLTEQGTPGVGAAGSAYLTAKVRTVLCPVAPAIGAASGTPACIGPVANTGDCSDPTKVDFSQVAAVTLTFSTGLVNARVLNPRPSLGPSMISRTGVPFVCANWTTENSPGSFILPFLLTDGNFAGVPVGDVANVLQIID